MPVGCARDGAPRAAGWRRGGPGRRAGPRGPPPPSRPRPRGRRGPEPGEALTAEDLPEALGGEPGVGDRRCAEQGAELVDRTLAQALLDQPVDGGVDPAHEEGGDRAIAQRLSLRVAALEA